MDRDPLSQRTLDRRLGTLGGMGGRRRDGDQHLVELDSQQNDVMARLDERI